MATTNGMAAKLLGRSVRAASAFGLVSSPMLGSAGRRVSQLHFADSTFRSSRVVWLPTLFKCRTQLDSPYALGPACRLYSTGSGGEDEEEEWCEDPEGEKNLDPAYKPPKVRDEPKYYGFSGEDEEYSDDEYVYEDENSTGTGNFTWKDYIGNSYDNAPFAEKGITYEKWAELKRELDAIPREELDNMDLGDEGPKQHQHGGVQMHSTNPNEHKHYKTKPKTPEQQERMRKFKEEWLKYRRIANQWDFEPRTFSEDPHIERVKAKLATLKPDADGKYRNLMHYVSDIDILLYAYRVIKARKLGPGTDCTTIPIDNIKMDWFYQKQKELREGTFKFKGEKIVFVKKKDFNKRE